MAFASRRSSSRLWLWLIFIGVIVAVGIGMRMHSAHALKQYTRENAVPVVTVIQAAPGPAEEEIILPGSIQPWHEATLYARTNGYLKSWVRTMGMRVKKGELIAQIETPEIDAQLRQANADLKTAEANDMLAQSTVKRWKKLLKTESVSKQEADEKISDAAAKSANLASVRAARDHLQELQRFKEVRAPFDGIITSRTTDIGALISAGSGTQQPLFRIQQADYLRVYVRVPQRYSSQIKSDMVAELHFDEHPGKIFTATFVTTAEAIDSTNQSMLTEFKIDNRNGELLAGGYAQVHLKLPAQSTAIRVPVNTLLFGSDGPHVAIVDAQHHTQLRPVTIGRDFGNSVEIIQGLEAQEQVIVNPSDSTATGQEVQLAAPKKSEEGDTKKDEKHT